MCILVEEDNSSLKRECLIKSDNINIIGFAILNQDYESIYDIYKSDFKYSKFALIGNISNITVNKNGIFTCKNHNLNNGYHLLIKNSTLPINGIYKTSLNIINKDTFTLNIDTTKFKIKDNLGEIYSIKKLDIKTHNLNNKNLNNINKDESNIILFDKKIKEDEYNDIIEACIPKTIDYITHLISKEYNLYKIFNLYNIFNINQWIKLDNDDNTKFIKKINKKINKILKLHGNVKFDFKNLNSKSISDLTVSDDIFFAKDIVDNYGTYQLKGTKQDSNYLRLNWIQRQVDLGVFYYKYVIKVIYKEFDKSQIQKIINLYKKKLDQLKEKIGISNKYDTYEVRSLDEINDPKKGDIALIKSEENEDDGNIYVYNTKWSFVKKDTSQTIQELCLFKTDDLKNIKIKNITSEYIDEQCNTRKADYYKTEYQETLKDYNELLLLQNKTDLKLTLENEYNLALKTLKLLQFKLEVKKDKTKTNKNDTYVNSFKQIFIVNKINTLNNKFYLKYFIYKLLDLDGITIGNTIYSKKYKMPLVCGHWKYLKDFEYSSSLKNKNIIGNKLLDTFCDESNGYKYCKNCGELLHLVDYDEVDGFTKDGHLIVGREVMVEDKMISNDNKTDFVSNCSIDNIRNLLLKKGIPTDNLRSVLDICNIIKLITEKIGLALKEIDFITIILESNTFIKDIISFSKYKKIKINLLIKQGKEKIVPKLEQTDYFKNNYLEYYNLNKYCVISCFILFVIQTSIPKYILKNPKTTCSLSSIEGRDGINYMSCIIKESGALNYEIESARGKKKLKKITDAEIYEEMEKKYYEFIEKPMIKTLFKKKEKYNETIIKKTVKVKYIKENKEIPDKLPSNFSDYLLGKKGDKDTKKDYIRYYKRYKYVNLEIMRIIHHVVSTSELESTVAIQNTCCFDTVDNDYYNYIIKKNNDIKDLIEEVKSYSSYNKLFNKKGTLTTMYTTYEYVEDVGNVNNFNIIDDDICKKTLLYYNYNNSHSGLKRIYLGNVNNKYDIISNRYKKDILKDDIDEESYYKLLLDIQSHNTKLFKKYIKSDISKYYDSLKQFDYIQKIDSLVNKLTVYLKKDDTFKKELKEKLRRLGLKELTETNTLKEKILQDSNIYVNKINNLKIFINDYFRKYINLIKNKYLIKNIPTLDFDDDKNKQILQKLLIDEHHSFKDFFVYSKIFKDIKFDYSINEINNFIGDKVVYSKDWKKVKQKSLYSYKMVSEMLHFILINQLDSMLYQKESVEINNKTVSGETINIMLSEFIYKVLQKIESDNNKVNVDKDRYNQYRECLYYQNNKFRYKAYNETGKELLKEMYGETDKEALDDKIKEFKEQTREKYKQAQEQVDGMIEGQDLSEQEVSDMVEDVLYEEDVDEAERDEYDISQAGDVDEVLGEEDDYGELLDEDGINQGELEAEMENL